MNALWGIADLRQSPVESIDLKTMSDGIPHFSDRISSVFLRPRFAAAIQVRRPSETATPFVKQQNETLPLVVAVGHLTNLAELRHELSLSEDAAISEGEIIATSYAAYGLDFVQKLQGDWSVAIWDAARGRCILARDATGTGSLYWWCDGGVLVFATSLQAVLAHPSVPHRPDLLAVACMAARRVSPLGEDVTSYEGVRRLLPGRMLFADAGALHVNRWWRPEALSTLHFSRDSDYYEAFADLFSRAVADTMERGSGPVGASLSGGLDSGCVVSVAAPHARRLGRQLLAYTHAPLYTPDGVFPNRLENEFLSARLTAAKAGVEIFPVRSESTTILQGVRESLRILGEPVRPAHNFYWTMDLLRHARLAGASTFLHGGGGNATISYDGGASLWPEVHQGHMKAVLASLMTDKGGFRQSFRRRILGPIRKDMIPPWQRYDAIAHESPFRKDKVAAFHLGALKRTFAPKSLIGLPRESAQRLGLMDGVDPGQFWTCAAAAHQMEVYDPTRDQRIVEFCWRTPGRIFWANGERRGLIRLGLREYLPDEVLFPPLKGLQASDFGRRVLAEREELRVAIQVIGRHPLATEWLDLDRMNHTLSDLELNLNKRNVRLAQQILMRGLTIGYFLIQF